MNARAITRSVGAEVEIQNGASLASTPRQGSYPVGGRRADHEVTDVATSRIDNPTKRKLEQLFDMSSGYVLDFSNASFASFVETCVGFDPYERYQGSKAVILRKIWLQEPMQDVAKLNLELLEHWHLGKLAANEDLTRFEEHAYSDLKSKFVPLATAASQESLGFLERDFGDMDLSTLPSEVTARRLVEARLDEIVQCLSAEAPLAVIFLVGSTLEGLLMEVALAHPSAFTTTETAPMLKGRPKPVDTWTLSELITVARSLGVIGEDVSKYADHVRDFRNYIHPRQQLREKFEPRMITAQIAEQVLRAALADLKNLGGLER